PMSLPPPPSGPPLFPYTTLFRSQPAVALEGIFMRDEIRQAAGLPAQETEVTPKGIWSQDLRLSQLLEQLPAAKHKHALQSFKESDRKSTRLNSSHLGISYAVFCL